MATSTNQSRIVRAMVVAWVPTTTIMSSNSNAGTDEDAAIAAATAAKTTVECLIFN